MESKPTILSFLLGVSVTLGFFLLVAATHTGDNGRYQMTVERGDVYVIDSRTGTFKVIGKEGKVVMHWDTHYVNLYKMKP